MQKILIVEDSPEIQLLVKTLLEKKYDVKVVGSAKEAVEELKRQSYPLMILDIGLPDEDGLQLCAKLRLDEKFKDMMIVFLTGKDQVNDKIVGFSLGADDYIPKPFNPLEFTARIEAKLRRIEDTQKSQQIFFKGAFKMNLPLQKSYLLEGDQERELSLTSIEFKLLNYFLHHEEHVLTREQILNDVWGTQVHVTDRTVDTHVYTLRQKLGKRYDFIQSVPRQGYKFSQRLLKSAA